MWEIGPDDPGVSFWILGENELVSTGFLAASEVGGERVPLDPAVAPSEREDELVIRLETPLTSASQVVRASAEVADSLAAIPAAREAVVEFERRQEEPLTFDLRVTAQAGAQGFEALGALFALRADGWIEFEDDGWSFDGAWSRDAGRPGGSFLTNAAVRTDFWLRPWCHTRASVARARLALDWPPTA